MTPSAPPSPTLPFGHATYLVILLLWCLPILGLQWAVAGRALWRVRRLLVATVVVCGTWLSVADGIAIARGVWQIQPAGTVPIRLMGGHLPLEEALFYYLTVAMSAQGFAMLAFRFKPKGTPF